MRITTLIFLILFPFILTAQPEAQWRGPGRDGFYPEKGLLKSWPADGPQLLWHFDELGKGHASAAVTNDRIYTAGVIDLNGFMFCFDLDGKIIWKMPYGEEFMESWPGTRSTPLIDEGKLFFLSGMGKLICLDAATGTLIWTTDINSIYGGVNIQWGYTENLLVNGNVLYCTPGGPVNNVVALEKNTGKLIWSSKGNGELSAYCSPIIVKLPTRTVFVTQTANSVIGIDAANGKLLWHHDQPNKWSVHANTPIYHDGQIFASSGYGQGGVMLKLSADGSSVSELWHVKEMDNRMGGFVYLNGKIYGADDSNKAWYCIDWNTGKILQAEKITGRGVVIAADGMLYCYSDTGEMVLAEATETGFKKVSSFKVPFGSDQHWAHPVIKSGKLYIRHGNSLMVYKIKG